MNVLSFIELGDESYLVDPDLLWIPLGIAWIQNNNKSLPKRVYLFVTNGGKYNPAAHHDVATLPKTFFFTHFPDCKLLNMQINFLNCHNVKSHAGGIFSVLPYTAMRMYIRATKTNEK